MKLIKTKDLDALNKSDKTLISAFLLTQWYRTKETRERIRDYNKQLKTFLTEHGDLSENLKNELNTDNDYIKEIHLPLFREIPDQIAYVLNMKWILMINRTDMPFWSSDSPISLDNFLNPSKFNSYGLYSEGITIHFPLTPEISLCFSDPEKFRFFPKKVECNNIQNIIYQNALQVKSSYRNLFSNKNEFKLAEKILKNNPRYKDPNRKRWGVKFIK